MAGMLPTCLHDGDGILSRPVLLRQLTCPATAFRNERDARFDPGLRPVFLASFTLVPVEFRPEPGVDHTPLNRFESPHVFQ